MTGKKTKEFLNLLRLASIFLLEEFFQVVHAGGHGGQEGIQDGKGGHGFYHYHGTRGNDGVMAAFDLDLDFFTLAGYGFLGSGDGGVGLKAALKMIGAPSLIPPVIPPE